MAATVIESFAVPCRSRSAAPASAPRASASVSSPLGRRGLGLLPQFSGLRCASVPLKVKLAAVAARSRVVGRGAVVCEVQETAVQLPDVTKATWQSLVLDSSVPVLVDFWAPWCGPCRMIEPTIAKLAKVYEGKLKCYKLNTDENPDIATQYGIRSIPTMMIFKTGEKKDTVIGAVPESTLVTSIEKFIKR
ncbi:Thioredoxin [Musa troglodytarum]|uniref:Thioredoxin n=1 Tax=Musa troglodytarum TaxID=320322 RepID=A0A9E7FRM3_9LILI|nr:Thioredoxin [Musa troglodytarum]